MCMVGFDIVTPKLKRIGTVFYEKEPRWRFRRNTKLYSFSCGFTRHEFNSFLPFPNIPLHDNFIMLVSQFKDNYGIVNKVLAQHRWSGTHNVSSHIDSSPFVIKLVSSKTNNRRLLEIHKKLELF